MKEDIFVRIDFQNDFVHPKGALTISAPELIRKHKDFIKKLTSKTFDKYFDTYDTHFKQTFSLTKEALSYPLHCVFKTWGWRNAAPFSSDIKVLKLYKSTTNLWNEKPQYTFLNKSFENTNVYLCGVLSEVCVKEALDGFLKLGGTIYIIEDLCQGLNAQINDILKENFYQSFIKKGQLHIISSAHLLKTKGTK